MRTRRRRSRAPPCCACRCAASTPDGRGLRLPRGRAAARPSCGRSSAARGWSLARRARAAARRRRAGAARLSLRRRRRPSQQLCARAARRACARELIEPLCVAALNTPADARRAAQRVPARAAATRCSAAPGAADLLLPRADLGALLPEPAAGLAARRTAPSIRLGASRRARIERAATAAGGSTASAFDAVVLARRRSKRRAWSRRSDAGAGRRSAAALRYEPIVTVYAAQRRHAPARADARAARRDADRAGAVRLRPRRSSAARPACSPSSSAAPQAWVERGIGARRCRRRWRRRRRALGAAPARAARGAAHLHREARDLRAARRGCGVRRSRIAHGLCRGRRLRRRALPGDARRRGARRHAAVDALR